MSHELADKDHEYWMRQALVLADKAQTLDEVPIGALIIKDQKIIGSGYNLREMEQNVLRHAEIDAIDQACSALKSWRLEGCTLYVTLEPCLMCAGAMIQARMSNVVFGALDPKAGAMGSLYSTHNDARLNHQLTVITGVLTEECSSRLTNFFKAKRKSKLVKL